MTGPAPAPPEAVAVRDIETALHLLTDISFGHRPDVAELHEVSLNAYAALATLEVARLTEQAQGLSLDNDRLRGGVIPALNRRFIAAEAENKRLREHLAEARKTLEVIEEPMHFDEVEAIADDRVRMQAAARAWLTKDRALLAGEPS